MTRLIEGLDRSQASLLPACIDDYVDSDNAARVIDAFIGMLDLGALGFQIKPEVTGRPGYHPATMLKIYSTVISIRCSRRVGSSGSARAISS